MAEDVAEADQDRQADAAQLQVIDQLLQVDRPVAAPSWRATRTWPLAPTEK